MIKKDNLDDILDSGKDHELVVADVVPGTVTVGTIAAPTGDVYQIGSVWHMSSGGQVNLSVGSS